MSDPLTECPGCDVEHYGNHADDCPLWDGKISPVEIAESGQRGRIRELEAERDQLRDAIETKVAQWLCPVHGSAACPEGYMLRASGVPYSAYQRAWNESVRCGQRPTTAAVLGEQSGDPNG